MLEDKKIEFATEIYNKFQYDFYCLNTKFCVENIADLQIEIMLLQYNCKVQNSLSDNLS